MSGTTVAAARSDAARDLISPVSAEAAAHSALAAIQTAQRAEAAGDVFEQLERRRIESALSRLDEIYEPIRRRRDLLNVGLSRINGLRETMVAQLDAITPDADLEPSLSASIPQLRPFGSRDTWVQGADDEREGEHDGREPDHDDEASLVGTVGSPDRHAVGGTLANLGEVDLEDECEDEGAPTGDDEPELGDGAVLYRSEHDQTLTRSGWQL